MSASEAVRARHERRLGALVLESREIRDPDPLASADMPHSTDCASSGWRHLPWTPELRQWQARVELMREFAVPAPEPWPDLSDAALTATLESWAPPWITGLARRDILRGWI